MSTPPTFGASTIGQTEKALTAILNRELAGTGVTERQWVTLVVTAAVGGTVDHDELVVRLASLLKVTEAEADAHITALAAAELLQTTGGESPVTLTGAGRKLHGQVGAAVAEITERLWGDLPSDDLATAARVLSTILERANVELAAAGAGNGVPT
jgi:DNA-binding MarR family transcriptional regulator